MKPATLTDGALDGKIAVVACELTTAHIADGIVLTLQAALDDWNLAGPHLDTLHEDLNVCNARRSFDFNLEHQHFPRTHRIS